MTDAMTFIYPLIEGRVYTIGELRQTEATLLAERQSDQEYSAKLRTQKDKEINWAKSRNEEAVALMLYADHVGLSDAATFKFDPKAAADFEVAAGGETIKFQCTMAFRKSHGKESGGKRHKREMEEYNNLVLHGIRAPPVGYDTQQVLVDWRAGIADALTSKLAKRDIYDGQGICLLIYAHKCWYDNIDFEFAEIVTPAIESVEWRQVFKRVCVVDGAHGALASFD